MDGGEGDGGFEVVEDFLDCDTKPVDLVERVDGLVAGSGRATTVEAIRWAAPPSKSWVVVTGGHADSFGWP
jgi:hypothetical protein